MFISKDEYDYSFLSWYHKLTEFDSFMHFEKAKLYTKNPKSIGFVSERNEFSKFKSPKLLRQLLTVQIKKLENDLRIITLNRLHVPYTNKAGATPKIYYHLKSFALYKCAKHT
jgi:hypothetical protein